MASAPEEEALLAVVVVAASVRRHLVEAPCGRVLIAPFLINPTSLPARYALCPSRSHVTGVLALVKVLVRFFLAGERSHRRLERGRDIYLQEKNGFVNDIYFLAKPQTHKIIKKDHEATDFVRKELPWTRAFRLSFVVF